MPIISKIEQQKNNPERYNLYTEQNGQDVYLTAVDQDIIIEYGIKKDTLFDEQFLETISKEDRIKKGYQLALRYLGAKMRTIQEIRDYLQRKSYDDLVIHTIIDKLVKLSYVNDSEYAYAYVRQYLQAGKKGPQLILRALHEKGIHPDTIQKALSIYSDSKQLENAISYINNIVKDNKHSAIQWKRKVLLDLQRKGFSLDIIEKAIYHCRDIFDSIHDVTTLKLIGMKAHKKYSKYANWEYTSRMKRYLYAKGFQEVDINRFLQELTTEETFD
ncbi:hypothetical protein BHU72_02865 [Desulfuribacillus stibiiarsenatis]|uniref:Regulatory protein RecX n=1 Tax=Desulfuribacillus stibiiarsenatis TaxID=1390249 RepID=A0A1E5L6X6_9FIRM|nr:RecX family transcriptional regulator [Desulfuribacillus stibiiarsenatis]OEH85739.1 hypothetical protein BHU72_02865 [Desulfuribacillus stibiiarsenatis]